MSVQHVYSPYIEIQSAWLSHDACMIWGVGLIVQH